MKRRWSIKESYVYGDGSTGSSVGKPHTKLAAWFWMKLDGPPTGECVAREIVHHDDEMRRWGRPDFVSYPTDADRAAADALRAYIIPSVAPGESIRIDLGGTA